MEQSKQFPEALFFQKGSKAILLLHAYTGSYNDVRMLARMLESKGYTVYAPLFTGHGTKNPADILAEHPSTWWEDTTQALTFLRNLGYQQIAVFGLSMGGLYAMAALQEENVIGGGAFCSPLAPMPTTIHANFMLYARHYVTEVHHLEEIKAASLKQLSAIEHYSARIQQQLADIRVPVFLAQAGNDQLITPSTVYHAAQKFTQTRCSVQWYPKSGHVITVGPDRKEFEKDVLHFVEGLSWNEENNE